MLATKRFIAQHDELLDLSDQITACLNFIELAKDATKVRSLLSIFLGRLKVHLAMEDGSLYPVMLDLEDKKINEMARMFINEMGGVVDAVNDYAMIWASAMAIQDNPKIFITHTNKIMSAMARRIDKENYELFRAYAAHEKKIKRESLTAKNC